MITVFFLDGFEYTDQHRRGGGFFSQSGQARVRVWEGLFARIESGPSAAAPRDALPRPARSFIISLSL